nr:MAG TPA: hypothetical protein [Caudoviricetes sp.]
MVPQLPYSVGLIEQKAQSCKTFSFLDIYLYIYLFPFSKYIS